MALSDIVNLVISRTSRSPTRPGFGVPLMLVGKVPASWGANKVRQFGSLKEMTDAGFTVTDPAYAMATALLSQSPAPRRFKIAKRAVAATPTVTLTIAPAPAQGDVFTITAGATTVSYTAGVSPTPTTVATALAALILGGTGWTAVAAAGVITLTGAINTLPALSAWSKNIQVKDTTVDPGVTADLAAALAEDSDWYGLLLDSRSQAQAVAAAIWTEANKKLFIFETSDYGTTDPASTTDVLYALKAASYFRTAGLFNGNSLYAYGDAAWVGNRFPYDPSAAPDAGGTWAYKTLAGVTVSSMTDGAVTAVLNKNGSVYTNIAGINVTQFGKTAGGEWIDVIRFLDWLESEMKIRVFTLFAGSQKVPYTDAGINSIVNVIKGTLAAGVTAGGLADDPAPEVLAPAALEVTAIDRAARNLPGVTFTCRLAGAIHTVNINGSVSV